MVPRYARPAMSDIWTPESRFRIWFEIEAHATDALAELGVVPKEAAAAIWEKGAFEVDRIDALAAEVTQDVDRTSVVSGKSVSERVCVGGRRIIKKNKN